MRGTPPSRSILKYQGGLDKQKNVGEVGVLNATLGRYRENTAQAAFSDADTPIF